ncbi:alpha/beta fold hydrolase [Canibacter sp. lx-72]|uniref:alpha/beta fold hydrolase n=1 Tax=Canibacter zhuwentaonis TaxID=2837491 RepID=UPI001BDC76C2|nr:alpha/beta fold hydrolase [Canibacter zhuwentaonis]MBT1018262.1 alpha/beta fold hydrolase [Canibacter zhuwentaonis]
MLANTSNKTGVKTTFIAGERAELTVFMHGLLGRGRNFMQHAKELRSLSNSLLIDMPNHAESSWTSEFSYLETAELIVAAVKEHPAFEAARGKIHMLGHSMGGKAAMFIALLHHELIKSLIIVDIAPTHRPNSENYFVRLIDKLLALDLASLESRAAADQLLQVGIPDAAVRTFLLQNLARKTGNGFYWQANLQLLRDNLDSIMGFNAPAGAVFNGPVLWLAGEKSNYIKPDDFNVMQLLFPNTVPVTVPNAGHWVHADNPAEFDRLIHEHINANSN